MKLAAELGFDYLWIDALCIIQDSSEDQAFQIQNMTNIYASSFLTIIAASGNDCNSGLPGLHDNSRRSTQVVASIETPTESDAGFL